MGTLAKLGRSCVLLSLLILGSFGSGATDAPVPGDDATYRPTVMVRRGSAVGTGTVIASAEDETLVLTAWHVVDHEGPVRIELFRFNLGLERSRTVRGFPRLVEATVAARDVAADVAILRIKGQMAFPYVARLAGDGEPPPPGTSVTSIGFDLGKKLIGWSTKTRGVERVDMDSAGVRPFLITDHPPELGRSGGGLFRDDGTLVGVCVARAEFIKGRKIGLFSTLGNVRALLHEHEGLEAFVNRAEAARRPTRR